MNSEVRRIQTNGLTVSSKGRLAVTESTFCVSCGTQLPRAAKFCGNCGAKAQQTEEPTEGAAFSFSPQGQRIANELSSIQARLRALQVLNAVMDDVRQLWKADLHAIELAKASGSVAEVQRDFSPGWEYRFAEEWSETCDNEMEAVGPPPGECCHAIVQRLMEAGVPAKEIPGPAKKLYLEQYAPDLGEQPAGALPGEVPER